MMLILLFQKSIQAWLLVEGDSEGSAARQQSSGELWKEEKIKEWHIRATSKQARLEAAIKTREWSNIAQNGRCSYSMLR
ncbi:hypothetical protein PVAP13_5NG239000 [Panicum virgatum]|uniref:Uncharacterized protein n=1 Tax=Panicum virgatum TaxID=38727 RepID=A0A8T0RYE6_PANVG|nr:hypothetical protein PVAP13_5NG239000 [Panicum virgatum]